MYLAHYSKDLYNTNMVNKQQLKNIWYQVPPSYYYSLNLGQRWWHDKKWEVLKKLMTDNDFSPKTILEIGCAAGHLTKFTQDLFPRARVYGIDIYKPAIIEAKMRYPEINFQVADAHKLPFKKNYFDLVLCSETIEHVLEPNKMLAEIKRVISPKGHVVLEMDSGSPLFRFIWYVWTHFGKGRVWHGSHLHPFSEKELEQLIKRQNFCIVRKKLSHFGMAVSFLLTK